MRKTILTALVLAACFPAAPALADTLSGDELRQRIVDRTVRLSTPFGIELPLQYRSNGEVTGNISGFSMASMFAPRETGAWWVDGSRLCQQWPSWYDGEVHCFTITSTGEDSLSWTRNDGMTGTARIEG